MFEHDICFCGNSNECPKQNICRRAGNPGPGIYTVSLFYKKDKECEYFWRKEKTSND